MAKRKQRIRSPHPGVVIKRRALASGKVSWRACYIDPDTEREVRITLKTSAIPTEEARRVWAIEKSRVIAQRRLEIASGAPIRKDVELETAISEFLADAENQVAPSTLSNYAYGIERFSAWAEEVRLHLTNEITPAQLTEFRRALIAQPKGRPKKKARRGAHKESKARRQNITTNGYLTSTKILLNHMRRRGLTPKLTGETISDHLAPLPEAADDPEFLRPADIRALLAAVERHDLDTFTETREEHSGDRPKGTTYKHIPIAPYVLFLLLSGCRGIEARRILWSHVDLNARDNNEQIVGEIRLPAKITKNRRARTIGLEVSPMLRTMLMMMRSAAGKHCRDQTIFGPEYTKDLLKSTLKRLRSPTYEAPTAFTWKHLRATCDTFLVNSPGIFGASAAFLAAKQLGHSVVIAEKNYQGVLRGIPRAARTLEAAMEIQEDIARLLTVVHVRLSAAAQDAEQEATG